MTAQAKINAEVLAAYADLARSQLIVEELKMQLCRAKLDAYSRYLRALGLDSEAKREN
jgi:hypothetical protein